MEARHPGARLRVVTGIWASHIYFPSLSFIILKNLWTVVSSDKHLLASVIFQALTPVLEVKMIQKYSLSLGQCFSTLVKDQFVFI